MPINSGNFKKGNRIAKKEPKVVLRKFQEILKNAIDDQEILSWQDACLSIGWRVTKCDYWVGKHSVFETIKKEVHNIIISRINKKGLKGDYNPTMVIWRSKQSGETDTQYKKLDHTTKGDKLEPPIIVFND